MKTCKFLELTPKKDVLFILGNWNTQVGSQEIPGVTGKLGLGVQNEAGQKLRVFCQENKLCHSKHPFPTTLDDSTHGYHQMVNTEIRLIIFFAANNGEALYNQRKQDQELTVAQIINSLLQNSGLNWRSRKNHQTIQVWPKSNPLRLYTGGDEQIQGTRSGKCSAWRTTEGGF